MKAHFFSRGVSFTSYEVSTYDIKGVTASFNFNSNLSLDRLCQLPIGVRVCCSKAFLEGRRYRLRLMSRIRAH